MRAGVSLAPRRDIRMADNTARLDPRIACLQRTYAAQQTVVLGIREGVIIAAFQLYADGEVIDTRPTVKARFACVPGALAEIDKLVDTAIPVYAEMRRHAHTLQFGEVRMPVCRKAALEQGGNPVATVLAWRQRDRVYHQGVDVAGTAGALVAMRRTAIPRLRQPLALGQQLPAVRPDPLRQDIHGTPLAARQARATLAIPCFLPAIRTMLMRIMTLCPRPPLRACAAALTALALTACAALQSDRSGADEGPDLPLPELAVVEHRLDNGLTLLVHEDRNAPVAGVYVWYRVGSKDESPGRKGFAHLFEHLMFTGTEHYDGEFFAPLLEVGATAINGTTSVDRTDYFQTVPTPALDRALWLESQRMGYFIDAVTQEKLDREIDVVKNEYRQYRDQPYGKIWDRMVEATYPAGHPHSWPTIGYMEDVEAATLDTVREWFERFYGASNAVLVVAGDVDADHVIRRVEHYFGSIRPGPDLTHPTVDVARMRSERRDRMRDDVPQARLLMVWNVPPAFSEDTNRLQLAAEALSSGRASPLQRRLVEEEELATRVSASVWEKQLGSQFIIDATAADGVSLSSLEAAIDDILHDFLRHGPTPDALQRARVRIYGSAIRGLQSVDGHGKSGMLARSYVLGGSANAWHDQLQSIRNADSESVRRTAAEWLDDGRYVMEVVPRGTLRQGAEIADRAELPTVASEPPALRLPELEYHRLSNGLRVALARREGIPQVEFRLIADAGYATDAVDMPGVASMAESLRTRGTTTRDAIVISEDAGAVGAQLSSAALRDHSIVSLSAVWPFVDESLELFADVLRNPTFPEDELERQRRRQFAAIAQEKAHPTGMITRVLPTLLYGREHPYAQPASGTGTEGALAVMRQQDLLAYQSGWIRPDNAGLLVVGDIDAERLLPMLERHLGDWRAADTPKPVRPDVAITPAGGERIFLIDRPGATQSHVVAARLAPPSGDDDDIAFDLLNQLLGGSFTARLNQRLRIDTGWSYSMRSVLTQAVGPRPFYIVGAVQSDRTADSMAVIADTIDGLRGALPASPVELDTATRGLTMTLPARNQTLGQITATLTTMLRLGLPEDHFAQYIPRAHAKTPDDLLAPAARMMQPRALTWLVVGDRRQIEAPLRALGFGELLLIDVDGQLLPMED